MGESIWKKEISFRRKPNDEGEPAPTPAPPRTARAESVWKKEVSLRRSVKQEPEPVPDVEELAREAARTFAASFAAPDVEPDVEQKVSLWKKEIRIGRKSDAGERVVEALPTLPATPESDPVESAPVPGAQAALSVPAETWLAAPELPAQ